MKKLFFGTFMPLGIVTLCAFLGYGGCLYLLGFIGLINIGDVSITKMLIHLLGMVFIYPLVLMLQFSEAYSKGISRKKHLNQLDIANRDY